MTPELQRAMARYEEARARYQKAVLDSIDGDRGGEAIRAAIQEFKVANAELRRLRPTRRLTPPHAAPKPVVETDAAPFPGWALFRRLLDAS